MGIIERWNYQLLIAWRKLPISLSTDKEKKFLLGVISDLGSFLKPMTHPERSTLNSPSSLYLTQTLCSLIVQFRFIIYQSVTTDHNVPESTGSTSNLTRVVQGSCTEWPACRSMVDMGLTRGQTLPQYPSWCAVEGLCTTGLAGIWSHTRELYQYISPHSVLRGPKLIS